MSLGHSTATSHNIRSTTSTPPSTQAMDIESTSTSSLHNSRPISPTSIAVDGVRRSNEEPHGNAMADNGTKTSAYGTRSRNRTSTARVNYAEDADTDFEIAISGSTPRKQKSSIRKAPLGSDITTSRSHHESHVTSIALPPQDMPNEALSVSAQIPRRGPVVEYSEDMPGMNTFAVHLDHSWHEPDQHESDPSSPVPLEPRSHRSALLQSPKRPSGTANAQVDDLSSKILKSAVPTQSSSQAPVGSSQASKKRKAPGLAPDVALNSLHNQPMTGLKKGNTNKEESVLPGRRKPTAIHARRANRSSRLMSFERCQNRLQNGRLVADDGTRLAVDDQVYLICEPPGEPYYLARIMEFLHADNDESMPIDSIRVNWYLRPRDIQRRVNDSRLVFASMQSDISPISSLRGKCRVLHRHEISNLEDYRKEPDSFWYEKLFDRYIHRYYEVIPTSQVINVPGKVKKVLDERWKYVVVEIGRGKELTSAIKSCRRCHGFCASNDSVDCAVCKKTYHMNCIDPPLLKKPARGFGWSCAPCSRKQEQKLEARDVDRPRVPGEKFMDEEDDDLEEEEGIGRRGIDLKSRNTTPDNEQDREVQSNLASATRPPTAQQLAQAKLWPYRYLGIHCQIEDALDYDDRIYPRASSRIGTRHQATVPMWHGHPTVYVKGSDTRRKQNKGMFTKKDSRQNKEHALSVEANIPSKESRPKWMVDAPSGYVARGEDYPSTDSRCTATPITLPPSCASLGKGETVESNMKLAHRNDLADDPRMLTQYVKTAQSLATPVFNLPPYSTNFLDKALELYLKNDFDTDKALAQLKSLKRRQHLKEPVLNAEELKKFESGVAKFGSELRNVSRHVGKSQRHGEIVRFYYMWKKTERGRRIWDSFEGRKGKKHMRNTDVSLLDDVADEEDDSAFDDEKASQKRRGFECKFCGSRSSPHWRRAPATAPGATVPIDPQAKPSKDKSNSLMIGLCQRCGGLWRRYGIQWEDIDEVARRVAQGGGRAGRRRPEEDLLVELVTANKANDIGFSHKTAAAAATVGIELVASQTQPQDTSKKRIKSINEEPSSGTQSSREDNIRKRLDEQSAETASEPQLILEQPRFLQMPCDICQDDEGVKVNNLKKLLTCQFCRLTVHAECYGCDATQSLVREWHCGTCANDIEPVNNSNYDCIMCTQHNSFDKAIFEPLKPLHRKKTDREKEKNRLERGMITQATELYRQEQIEKGRPVSPRQSVKPTSQHQWCHVICSILHPSIQYSEPAAFKGAEGFAQIPYDFPDYKGNKCRVCKDQRGYVVSCHECAAPVHGTCAQRAGFRIGIQLLAPSKGSNGSTKVTISGSSGIPEVRVFCPEHGEQKQLHSLAAQAELDGTKTTAIQAYAIVAKSVPNMHLTGSARRAELIQAMVKAQGGVHGAAVGGTRGKTKTNGPTAADVGGSAASNTPGVKDSRTSTKERSTAKTCAWCHVEVSPLWHESPIEEKLPPAANASGKEERCCERLCHKCHLRKKQGLSRNGSSGLEERIEEANIEQGPVEGVGSLEKTIKPSIEDREKLASSTGQTRNSDRESSRPSASVECQGPSRSTLPPLASFSTSSARRENSTEANGLFSSRVAIPLPDVSAATDAGVRTDAAQASTGSRQQSSLMPYRSSSSPNQAPVPRQSVPSSCNDQSPSNVKIPKTAAFKISIPLETNPSIPTVSHTSTRSPMTGTSSRRRSTAAEGPAHHGPPPIPRVTPSRPSVVIHSPNHKSLAPFKSTIDPTTSSRSQHGNSNKSKHILKSEESPNHSSDVRQPPIRSMAPMPGPTTTQSQPQPRGGADSKFASSAK